MKKCLILISVCAVFGGFADGFSANAKDNWKTDNINRVYFNQALLRECTPYLSKISGVKIDLSERLSKKRILQLICALILAKNIPLKTFYL